MTAEEALTWVNAGHADGIGLTLTAELGWVAVDLDACITQAHDLTADAAEVLRLLPEAYVEVSPSGTGLHVLTRGRLPSGWRRQHGVDLIDTGYVTVTCQCWRPELGMPDMTSVLHAWHAARTPPSLPRPHRPSSTAGWTDEEVLRRARRARNGRTFQALWLGEHLHYPSPSEADLALTLMLMHWAGPLAPDSQIDRLFRHSGRYRARWDHPTHHPYGARTITRARLIRTGVHP